MRIAFLSLTLALVACDNKGEINTGDTGTAGVTDGGSTDGGSTDGGGGGTDEGSTDGGTTDGGSTGGTTDGGSTGGGSTGDCGVEVEATWPEDGDDAVYYRDDVTFYLSDADPTATITVDGVTGTVTFNDAGDEVTFSPDGEFDSASSYTATLIYCAGEESITFSTSDLGDAVDPDVLIDMTYSLDLSSGTIVEPPGLETLLDFAGFSLDQQLLIGVESISETEIDFLGALPDASGEAQDFCAATLDFPPADFTAAPYFQIGPQDLATEVAGYEVTINNILLAGTFSADGSWVGGVEFAGDLDLAPIADAIGFPISSLCAYAAIFGISCEDCGDGRSECLGMVIQDMDADAVETVLEPIEMNDCHAECPTSADNPDCPL